MPACRRLVVAGDGTGDVIIYLIVTGVVLQFTAVLTPGAGGRGLQEALRQRQERLLGGRQGRDCRRDCAGKLGPMIRNGGSQTPADLSTHTYRLGHNICQVIPNYPHQSIVCSRWCSNECVPNASKLVLVLVFSLAGGAVSRVCP